MSLSVDDLLLASDDINLLKWLKNEFCKRFEKQDCGEANTCLGFEIRRDRSKKILHLSQARYSEKVLERFGILDSKPIVIPMDGQLTLSNVKGEPVHSTLYRQVIGCLMYLAVGTPPDI